MSSGSGMQHFRDVDLPMICTLSAGSSAISESSRSSGSGG